MANYAITNPGKYHLGYNFPSPPYQNREYDELLIPFKEVRWKCSCIINRRAYIGNVKITKEDGSVHNEPDTIYKSRVNKFDTFTERGKITVATGDGEDIIALVDYADRILQFKDKTLHIINAQQKEFLEDSHKHKGVANFQAVAKTDYGVAWANSHGAYLYDGRNIIDLIERKGNRAMKFSTWDSFVTSKISVGFIPDKRQLLFVDAYDDSANGDIFLYDMLTKSWVSGKSKLDFDKSNAIVSHTGKLIWSANNGTTQSIYQWDDSSDNTSNLEIITADIDFEQPGIKKSIKKVYISYTSASSGDVPTATYGVDGGTPTESFESGSFVINKSKWTTATFVVDESNVRSFQIKISGTVTKGFEINDISIVYRPKRVI